MNRPLLFLIAFLCASASLRDASSAESKPTGPNIVLIFVDDLGYGDLGCYGNETIETPNIDRLASEGQRWTSFYASGHFCVPSRRGLMSGRHPSLLRKEPLGKDREALLPAMLKRQGYATALLGKWHLAGYPENYPEAPMHPLNCGFDFYYGTPGSNDAPGPPKQTREAFDRATPFTWNIPLWRNRTLVEQPTDQRLFTRRYTEEAIRWIREQTASGEPPTETDGRSPFFLYLAHNMPHAPIFASEEFAGKSGAGLYADVIEELDGSVGEILKALEETGIDEETLVIFTSDNGPWTVFGPHGGSAGPLRGEKLTTWEGGSRVPGIFRWPGTIEPAVVDGIGVNLDLYATFATLAGADDLPLDKPGWMSIDLTPTLLEGAPSPRTEWMIVPGVFRSGNYKIVAEERLPTEPTERRRREPIRHDPPLLFDLSEDIGETTNLAAEHPEIVEKLQRRMNEIAQPQRRKVE